jgi:hypothetical protein
MAKLMLDDVADFTYCWGNTFFLETAKGNYEWSDPEYPGGDNSIKKFNGNLKDFYRHCKIPYGRGKGEHVIRNYCGPDVKIVD